MNPSIKWHDLPIEIQEKMLYNQQIQTGIKDKKAFIKLIDVDRINKGFTWEDSSEGHIFWRKIIIEANFDDFYKMYPKIEKRSLTSILNKY